jgi:hypothetical protein
VKATGERVEICKQFLSALGKQSFPGKSEFLKMVNEERVKKETIEEFKAQQAAATRNMSFFGGLLG